jgi:hypothetical protein
MCDVQQPENAENTIMYVLTTQQIRALACQNKLEDWQTESIGKLKRQLLGLAQETDILSGVDA